jgi:hypothetical protein
MKLTRLVPMSLALLLSASVAGAQDKPAKPAAAPAAAPAAPAAAPAAPAGPPKPAPELDATFKVLEGSWKCDSTYAANAMGPGSPEIKVKTTIKFKKELGGFWYRGDYESKKTKDFPGMKGTVYLGHDGKQFLTSNIDSMGGMASGTGTAAGDTLTFVNDAFMMGKKMKMRETMATKGDKEIVHKFEVDTGKGFQPMGEDLCKK